MGEMKIDLGRTQQLAGEIRSLGKDLGDYSERIEQVSQRLRRNRGVSISALCDKIDLQNEEVLREAARMEKLSSSLSSIVIKYTETEERITGYKSGKKVAEKKSVKRNESPYDDRGSYGGNQSSPLNHKEKMRDLVRKHFPEFTDAQIDDYLKKLENEGCGYVAICNTLFLQYIGREDDFEKTFGFPMYDENGDFNYDALVTDFYCATDNHNQKGILWWKHDSINTKEDETNTVGKGTNRESRKYRYEMYMKDHGIDVEVKNVNISPKNYDSISQKGEIIVAIHPCVLYDGQGRKVVDIQGGHAMTVTGVTSDGMLIVSSWGKKYYIKPGSYGREQYQQVIYK